MTQPRAFKQVDELAAIEERLPTYLAIGVFDGVHLGHQSLLRRMVAAARAAGARPTVLTFFPHPVQVIQGLTGRLYLITLARRVALLADLGIELVIVHRFDEAVRQLRARDFIAALHRHLDLKELWGGSFTLGYKREGTADYLSTLGRDYGFTVRQIQELVEWKGERVSSSRIRRALEVGDVTEARGCLGRPFHVGGQVIRGDRRGHTIGFPTANLDVWEQKILPANGVYATYAWLGDRRFLAATNVGVRPTVADPRLSVEAHLLDFDGDIYGEHLALEFIARIREERKFSGLQALKEQIGRDVQQATQLLAPAPPT